METIRKNITLPTNIYETINNHAKKNGMTFSEFIREAALKVVIQNENMGLLEYINKNCSFVSKDEQLEIEAMNIDFENFDGKEITLDELLQG